MNIEFQVFLILLGIYISIQKFKKYIAADYNKILKEQKANMDKKYANIKAQFYQNPVSQISYQFNQKTKSYSSKHSNNNFHQTSQSSSLNFLIHS